jgi:hypothetical protein
MSKISPLCSWHWREICTPEHFVLCFSEGRFSVADPEVTEISNKSSKSKWLWPAGAVATGLAGAALVLLRGCWHSKMSWPVRSQGYSYQVCLGCGVKRLFDEKGFRSYGPFRYDLDELIVWDRSRKPDQLPVSKERRPAS